jgi:hypothetical protein
VGKQAQIKKQFIAVAGIHDRCHSVFVYSSYIIFRFVSNNLYRCPCSCHHAPQTVLIQRAGDEHVVNLLSEKDNPRSMI